jgi:hypothetical protein
VSTTSPFFINKIVGIDLIPYFTAKSCSSSVFTLQTFAFPSKSAANSSKQAFTDKINSLL